MAIDISNQVRIQSHPEFWYTVEDYNIDVGCDGCTISEWVEDKRIRYICINKEESIVLAEQILKFAGKQ